MLDYRTAASCGQACSCCAALLLLAGCGPVGITTAIVALGKGDSKRPFAPEELTAFPGRNDVLLTWKDRSTGETGFRIERRATGAPFVEVGTAAAEATSFNDAGLMPYTNYEYRVQSFDAFGFSSYSNVVSVLTLADPPQLAITAPTLGAVYSGVQDISWTTATPAPGTVHIRLDEGFSTLFPVLIAEAAPDVQSFSFDGTSFPDSLHYRLQLTPVDSFGQLGPAVVSPEFELFNNPLLYDITFAAPQATVGNPPPLGLGPSTRTNLSTIVFGDPVVVAGIPGMAGQALMLDSVDNTAGGSDQVELGFEDLHSPRRFTLAFRARVNTLTATAPADGSGVIIDAPIVRRVDFGNDGNIRAWVPLVGQTILRSYSLGVTYQFRIDVDLDLDTWVIQIDAGTPFVGAFGGGTEISSIRFNAGQNGPVRWRIAVDDITVNADN